MCPDWDENPRICEHLEKLIRSDSSQSVPTVYRQQIDTMYGFKVASFPPKMLDGTYEQNFRDKLIKAGLDSIKVEVLIRRYMYDMTLKEISEDLSIISPRTVLNLIEQSMKFIKSKGKL